MVKISYLTASRASPIASSDQGVGFDLDSSIPSLLHLPYRVPVGMPNSVDAFCTEVWPVLIDSKAFSKSSGVQVVGAALNGAASLIPSLLAILYNVLLGIPETLLYCDYMVLNRNCIISCRCKRYIPKALLALLAEIVPVLKASSALLRFSSVQDFVGPSFFGVSIPNLCARCHNVVEGIP